jgi:hypothetical protein
VLALWLTGTYTVARFLTFLLVPTLIALSTGIAAMIGRPTSKMSILRTVVALTVLASILAVSVTPMWQITRLPREAHKDAATLLNRLPDDSTPIYAYMLQPGDLSFYSDRRVQPVSGSAQVNRLCAAGTQFALAVQLWRRAPLHFECSVRAGTQMHVFHQYARSGAIRVWLVRKEGSPSS